MPCVIKINDFQNKNSILTKQTNDVIKMTFQKTEL